MQMTDVSNLSKTILSRQRVLLEESYDVVVIGGGLAGICAAVTSARQGMRTVLLQDRPMLGGNASGEIGVIIQGADEMGRYRYSRETGLIDEIFTRNVTLPNPMQSASLWSLVLWEFCREQDNLTVYLNTIAKSPTMEADRIVSIRAEQNSTERDLIIKGAVFIDCSGDGRIGYESGAEYTIGRESKADYGEPLAVETSDGKTMGSTIYIKARDMGKPIPFKAPPWVHSFKSDEQLPSRGKDAPHNIRHLTGPNGGWWWLEFGGTMDTIKDSETIRDELIRYAIGMWDHLKNCGDHGADHYALESIGYVPGKRESRRFLGDYVLTQGDIESLRKFDDVVAYCQWHIDVHNPLGVSSNDKYWVGALLKGRASIPFRCLYSKNVGNLLFAGRNISITHVAMGSTRVMATCAIMGQAVGAAATLCVKHDCTPKEVGKTSIHQLQQMLLEQDCYLPGVSRQDKNDLAQQASVNASSHAPLQFPSPEIYRSLSTDTAQGFIVSSDRLNSVTIDLENKTDSPIQVRLHLRSGQWVDDFTSTEDIAISEAAVPPGRSKVRFDYKGYPVEPNSPYWVMLEKHEDLAWGFACEEPPCATGAWMIDQIYGDPAPYRMFKRERGVNCLTLDPPSYCFGPQQVLTGVTRPERSSNIWISERGLPQWIDLVWPKPVSLNEIHLTFDNNLDRKRSNWCSLGKTPELVRDYQIFADQTGELVPLLSVEENYLRKRVHRLDSIIHTGRLRLQVCSTWGEALAKDSKVERPDLGEADMNKIGAAARDYVDYDCDQARVYEVRVYNRPGY